MSKLLIPNTCQVPNVFFDELMAGLSNSSLRVLLAVVRFTYGFNKYSDRISLGQLQKATGMSRPGVVKGIKGLGSLLTIRKGDQDKRESNEYSLNLNVATGELVNHVNQSTQLTSKRSDKKPH